MSDHSQLLKTPLYQQHQAQGARIVDFGGWVLPVYYSSQIEEHHAVRSNAGMFDVSHMTVVDITGSDTLAFLSLVLANDINKVRSVNGKALYSCMLNERGGVIDDLIVYYLNDNFCRVVSNAATKEKDIAWLQKHAQQFTDISVQEKSDLALIAVQGPNAIELLSNVLPTEITDLISQLQRFQGGFELGEITDDSGFVGRTGYTGEDGVELIVPASRAAELWEKFEQTGIQPCGLGARDTLRLEAGMALYGADLDEDHTPLESGLTWTVAMNNERDFIGRSALQESPRFKMLGLLLEDKGVLRGHQAVLIDNQIVGEITSGTFSPTLSHSIALARINLSQITKDAELAIGSILQVQIRSKQLNARIVPYPFV